MLRTAPKEEFRAVWLTTVYRLDWPGSYAVTSQKYELKQIFDKLQSWGLNAVIFQVRPACDAFYDSPYEPWSNWLTGTEGQAPNPYYDPLSFAVQAAHERGLELHAWFNPYRAKEGNNTAVSSEHVSNEHPEWVLNISKKGSAQTAPMDIRELNLPKSTDYILDPGKADVRSYVLKVIMDVVNRYDIDGVHMDDYFYPYSGISNEDQQTFNEENRGFTNIDNWRRDNVNLLIESVYDSIKAVKPHVKFGMSPFGIWKNGVPSGIVGLDAYSQIYCDAVAWLKGQYVDYLTPQLYWPFGGGQDYGKLMPWWAGKAVNNQRHFYPGHAAYKASDWSANELPRQIRLNRNTIASLGSIYFRYNHVNNNPKGFLDSLRNHYYRYPALTPRMTWNDSIPPLPPAAINVFVTGDTAHITWSPPLPTKDDQEPYRYLVYKWPASLAPDTLDAEFIYYLTQPGAADSIADLNYNGYRYGVAALDRLNNESAVVVSNAVAIADQEPCIPQQVRLDPNYPNPFNARTRIQYCIPQRAPVELTIYDLQGREVCTLINSHQNQGTHNVNWAGTDNYGHPVTSGIYLYTLKTCQTSISRKMLFLK